MRHPLYGGESSEHQFVYRNRGTSLYPKPLDQPIPLSLETNVTHTKLIALGFVPMTPSNPNANPFQLFRKRSSFDNAYPSPNIQKAINALTFVLTSTVARKNVATQPKLSKDINDKDYPNTYVSSAFPSMFVATPFTTPNFGDYDGAMCFTTQIVLSAKDLNSSPKVPIRATCLILTKPTKESMQPHQKPKM